MLRLNVVRSLDDDRRRRDFPFFFKGNLGRIDYVNENEYDLFIRPDTCCPRFRCWFLFTVENVKADQVCGEVLFIEKMNSCSSRELFFMLSISLKPNPCIAME